MSHQKAAKEYPNSIFKQTTPDETQQLSENPRFSTWYKGWLTRSKIYERKLPDGIVGALRVDGPADGVSMALDNSGNIKLVTGVKDPNKGAGSGLLGIKTFGQQQSTRIDLTFSIVLVMTKKVKKQLMSFVMVIM